MKCELCHKADAASAIVRGEGDSAEELYVCAACAKAERLRHQKKSQRTRKVSGLPPGVSMSVTHIGPDGVEGDDAPPPILGAIVNAFEGMVSDLEKAAQQSKEEANVKYHRFSVSRVPSEYRIGNRLHLEGLSLVGELDSVKRAMHALRMDLVGVEADGIHDAGHVYTLHYAGSTEQAKRVVESLLCEELNARARLHTELSRILADTLGRSLAILKNCRLLTPGESFDILSPLRLAALADLLDGITLEEIERRLLEADLTNSEEQLSPDERDAVDADRADEINQRFEDVVLNERAEEEFQ